MDLPPAWYYACVCSHTFSVLQAYTFHKHSCQKTKKRLSNALDKAKEVWQSKKHRKMEVQNNPTAESPLGHHEDAVVKQESNDTAPAMQHEVGLMLLAQISH